MYKRQDYNHFFDLVELLDVIIRKSYRGALVIKKIYRCRVCVEIIKSWFYLYIIIRLYKYTPKVLLLINREYIYIIVNNNITSVELSDVVKIV